MNALRMVILTVVLSKSIAASPSSAEERVYTLQDAYQAAMTSNELVKISEENVIQSESRVDQAWSYLYPQLAARAAYTRYNDTLPTAGGPFLFQPLEQFQAALVLKQPLYTGGRTLAALRATEKMRESSANNLSFTQQEMRLRVAEAFFSVLKAQKSLEISKRSLDRMEQHKRITELEAATRKSMANRSALLRANSLVSQARITLVRSQDGIKIAREKLNLLTRLPLEAQLADSPPIEPPGETLEVLQKKSLADRDDYASSTLNMNIADEQVTIVKGGHNPQIYAEAGLQYQDSRPATAMDATMYYGGLRLQIPIFEGGLMKSEVSEARSKVRQAELSREFLRKTIESEVHEAYVNLQTVTSVFETARLQLDYARENFEAVEGLFSEGLIPSLSLIDAEQALTMAERELMHTTYDRQLAILRLKKSIGMLEK